MTGKTPAKQVGTTMITVLAELSRSGTPTRRELAVKLISDGTEIASAYRAIRRCINRGLAEYLADSAGHEIRITETGEITLRHHRSRM